MQNPLVLPVSRRQTLAALGTGAAGIAIASPASALQAAPKTGAQMLLDSVADNLIALSPEGATALGIDTGARAAERGKLGDRSAAGQKAVADTLKRADANGNVAETVSRSGLFAAQTPQGFRARR